MNHRTEILDLCTALAVLREEKNQLVETDVEVDPKAELSGVYRYVGAGGTVKRPTHVDGPAMLFHRVKGHPDASVVIGVLASRAADVTLKERRRLVVVPRETPMSAVHLRNLYELSMMGAVVLPPMLSYYHHPTELSDCTRHIVGKILDQFSIAGEGYSRWGE